MNLRIIKKGRSAFMAVLLLACEACSSRDAGTVEQDKLADWVYAQPQYKTLVNDVRSFYSSLKNKEWSVSYAYRTLKFKEVVSESVYENTLREQAADWRLKAYQVVGIHAYGESLVRFIIRTDESGAQVNYGVSWWQKEDHQWKCKDTGLSILPLANMDPVDVIDVGKRQTE